MGNIRGPISSWWYLYFRVIVFFCHDVYIRSIVPKKNSEQVIKYACSATYMLKMGLLGPMDNTKGPIRSYWYF